MCQPDTTLVPVKQEPADSPSFPTAIWPHIPVLVALPWPSSPPSASSCNSRCPTLCRLPSRSSLSSDLERHRHLLKAAVLPEKAELSQSPCGVQPSVPVFLWFSHHWAKPHGSSTTLHAELTVVPPKLPACPPRGVLFFGGAQEDGFQLQGRQRNPTSYYMWSPCKGFMFQKHKSREKAINAT